MIILIFRCPAWCDRVLLSHDAEEHLVHRQPRSNGLVTSSEVRYDVIGADVCMGDHKPVFLSFKLRLGSDAAAPPTGNNSNKIFDVSGRELPPSIESPSYTDLLDNSSLMYAKYIELRNETATSLKMFKETTV